MLKYIYRFCAADFMHVINKATHASHCILICLQFITFNNNAGNLEKALIVKLIYTKTHEHYDEVYLIIG